MIIILLLPDKSTMLAPNRSSRSSYLLASLLALGLGSCGLSPTTSEPLSENEVATATSEETLQVVTTFLPMTQFTKAVAGERAEVTQLLPTNTGPHDYQAKPTDVQAIANADVLVKNGLEIEVFLEDTVANANNPDLVVIDTSEGIATIAYEEMESHDDHDHDHDHDHDRDHDHDHDRDDTEKAESHEDSHGHHHHGEFDPHVWLDPKRAMEQVENIRDRLIAFDPEGEAIYTQNAEAYLEKLEALDREIAEKLSPHTGATFITFHDFATYFAERYDLEAEYLVDIPDENPSPEDVRAIVETVQAKGIQTLLAEPQAGESSFAAIANDLNISISVFDPIETGGSDSIQPDYYLEVMRQNANNLLSGFEAKTQSRLLVPNDQSLPQSVPVRVASLTF